MYWQGQSGPYENRNTEEIVGAAGKQKEEK